MKKSMILCLVAAGMAAIGCNQNESIPVVPEGGRIVTVRAVSAPLTDGTKVLADDAGKFTWEKGDAIGVWTGSALTKFTLDDDCDGQAEGTFTGTLPEGGVIDENSYAVYPYDYVTVEGTTAKLNVNSGFWARQAPARLVPMYAKAGTGHTDGFVFKHLGAVARFSIENLPEEIIAIYLEIYPGTPRQFWAKNGTTADLTADDPQWTGTGDEGYAFAIPEGEASHEKLDVYVPVIPGEYSDQMTLKVKLFKDSGASEVNEYTKIGGLGSKSTTYTRGQLLSMPTIQYPSPYPEHLYIYFWAWEDPNNAKEMTSEGKGIYTWTGEVPEWQFKFLTTLGEYWTGYFRDGAASDYWTLKEGGDECMFQLHDQGMGPGTYTFTVNLKTMKVTVTKPLPERLFIDTWEWGDGTKAKEMTALGGGKFTWEGILPRWNMKFTTSNATPDDYWTGYFRDGAASDYWTLKDTDEQTMFSIGDKGYRDGWFTVNVDLNTLKVEVIPHLWLIGAFSWGWTLAEAEEMTWDSATRTFSWTGQLYQGAFKFLVVNTDWYGYWRNSTEDNYWLAGENDAGDPQFDIAHDGLEAGVYTVTFHLDTKAVTVTPAS